MTNTTVPTIVRPKLLRPDMAIARRDGRKRQTRRVIVPQPKHSPNAACCVRNRKIKGDYWQWYDRAPDFGQIDACDPHLGYHGDAAKCPYQAGDGIRWLTTWAVHKQYDKLKPLELPSDVGLWSYHLSKMKPGSYGKLRPGRFLPKHLHKHMPVDVIKSIGVQKLQDISEEDAIAEGVEIQEVIEHPRYGPEVHYHSPIEMLQSLWNSINASPKPKYTRIDGKRVIDHYVSYPWEDIQETREHRGKTWKIMGNPWVWVVGFERISHD